MKICRLKYNKEAVIEFRDYLKVNSSEILRNIKNPKYMNKVYDKTPEVRVKVSFKDAESEYQKQLLKDWMNTDEEGICYEIEYLYTPYKKKDFIEECLFLIENTSDFFLPVEKYDYKIYSTNNNRTINRDKAKNFKVSIINAERDRLSENDKPNAHRLISTLIEKNISKEDRAKIEEAYNKFFDEMKLTAKFPDFNLALDFISKNVEMQMGFAQLLITSHNSKIINKFQLNNLVALKDGKAISFEGVDRELVNYLLMHPNFDILNLLFAKRVILVETVHNFLLNELIYPFSKYYFGYAYSKATSIPISYKPAFKKHQQLKRLNDRGIIHKSQVFNIAKQMIVMGSSDTERTCSQKNIIIDYLNTLIDSLFIDEAEDLDEDVLSFFAVLGKRLFIYMAGDPKQAIKYPGVFREFCDKASLEESLREKIIEGMNEIFDKDAYIKFIEEQMLKTNAIEGSRAAIKLMKKLLNMKLERCEYLRLKEDLDDIRNNKKIKVESIDRVKGIESNYCMFIINNSLLEYLFEKRGEINKQTIYLYVALTRSKKSLIIVVDERNIKNKSKKEIDENFKNIGIEYIDKDYIETLLINID